MTIARRTLRPRGDATALNMRFQSAWTMSSMFEVECVATHASTTARNLWRLTSARLQNSISE